MVLRSFLLLMSGALFCSSFLYQNAAAQGNTTSSTPSLSQGRSFVLPYLDYPIIGSNTVLRGSSFTNQSPTVITIGGLPRFFNALGGSFIAPTDRQYPQRYLLRDVSRPTNLSADTITPNGALRVGFDRPSELVYDIGGYKVLPETALGREYCVMSYSGFYASSFFGKEYFPSYTVVIATEDSTEVLVDPRSPTFSLGNRSRTIRLRRNEAYLVEAEQSLANQYGDVTGTRISSNKPIAVFGGTEGGLVPTPTVPNVRSSQSFMSEQQIPVSMWGREALLVPFLAPYQRFLPQLRADIERNSEIRRAITAPSSPLPRSTSRSSFNPVNIPYYARILAAYNGTEIFRNTGQTTERLAILQAGEFVEITFATATLIRASQPISVTQWTNRQDLGVVSTAMSVRPLSQYALAHTLATISLADSNDPVTSLTQGVLNISLVRNDRRVLVPLNISYDRVFEDYLTIIARRSDTANIRLDGRSIPAAQSINGIFLNRFQSIPGTDFAVATTAVSRGLHTVTSNLPSMVLSHGSVYVQELMTEIANSTNSFLSIPVSAVNDVLLSAGYAYSSYGNLQHERRTEAVGHVQASTCEGLELSIAPVRNASGQTQNERVLEEVRTSVVNAAVTPLTPTQNTDSVRLRTVLQNPFADGTVTITTTETGGGRYEQSYILPGFTLNLDGRREALGPLIRTVRLCADTTKQQTVSVRLTNYGTQTQFLRRVSLRSSINLSIVAGQRTVDEVRVREITTATFRAVSGAIFQQPTELLAAQTFSTRAVFTVSSIATQTAQGALRQELRLGMNARIDPGTPCDLRLSYRAGAAVNYQDTLFLSDGCRERPVLVLNVVAERDSTPPVVSRTVDACSTNVSLRFTQTGGECSRGLAGVELVSGSVQNVVIAQTQGSTNATGRVIASTATVVNPRLDAIYALRLRDSLGNVFVIRDTVPGFTLRVESSAISAAPSSQPPSLPSIALGSVPITGITCQTLPLRNTGVGSLLLDGISLSGNTTLSIPPEERLRLLGTAISPNGVQTVTICGAPLGLTTYVDTLTLERGCLREQYVVRVSGDTLRQSTVSRCGAAVRLSTVRAPQQFFMEQNYPNPASGLLVVRLSLSETSLARLTLTTSLGVEVKCLLDDRLVGGVYEIEADISDIPTGTYFLTLESGGKRQTRQMAIVR